jgi:hypothetical protein
MMSSQDYGERKLFKLPESVVAELFKEQYTKDISLLQPFGIKGTSPNIRVANNKRA